MQIKNTVETMHYSKSMKLMKKVNVRFIGLLLFVSLLQHFSFATLQNKLGLTNLNSGIVQNSYSEKERTPHHDRTIEIFAEVTAEDEDEVHNEQDFFKDFNTSNQTSNAQHYSNAIHILYLRLASTNQLKVDLPFFMLYNSWKSDLA